MDSTTQRMRGMEQESAIVAQSPTKVELHDGAVTLHLGDCRAVLPQIPDNTADAVVCDPPYELGFMGKTWDKTGIAYDVGMWREVLRVLKPGGHLLAFGGARTYHRLACAIEDAGFEVRDQIMWVYGCLDEKTQFVSENGVTPYTAAKVGDLALCYDPATREYSYQPILDFVEYDYSDTAYRLIGDSWEQIVSRNHRCIVERDGAEVFSEAETLEPKVRVPVLEDLRALRQALRDSQQISGGEKQDMRQSMCGRADRGEKLGAGSVGNSERETDHLSGVWEGSLEAGCVVAEGQEANVQPAVQWGVERDGVERTRSRGEITLEAGVRNSVETEDDGTSQSFMEGRADLSKSEGSVWRPTDQVCQVSGTIPEHGAERRICDAASSGGGSDDRKESSSDRGGSSHQSRCDGQSTGESDVVCDKQRSQTVRAWRGHRTSVVRVVPFHYTGKVWCLRVPTGAFVAVRGGVAFPTGNSGFPKSLDVSKVIDETAGVEREVIAPPPYTRGKASQSYSETRKVSYDYQPQPITAPSTDAAKQWSGWGTALKPAHEPICLARKPLVGTVAQNVLQHGTGAINVDGCRVPVDPVADASQLRVMNRNQRMEDTAGQEWGMSKNGADKPTVVREEGRWPANLIHDGSDEVLALFPRTKSGTLTPDMNVKASTGWSGGSRADRVKSTFTTNEGSAARFFYCSKASRKERGEGNKHPTVKPIALMRYLVRLVTPPGGVILDHMMGSGSTGVAAINEGFRFIGIEMEQESFDTAQRRVSVAKLEPRESKSEE
jgi:DNA modification methylase